MIFPENVIQNVHFFSGNTKDEIAYIANKGYQAHEELIFPSNPDINTGTLTLQTKVAGVKKLVVRDHGMSLLVKNLSVTDQKEDLGVP